MSNDGEDTTMGIEGIRCPDCKSTEVWKKGTVPTRQGKKVRYLCVDCGASFYDERGSVSGKASGKPGRPRSKKTRSKKSG